MYAVYKKKDEWALFPADLLMVVLCEGKYVIHEQILVDRQLL
jgi:5'(3')-deoxyribonucleotidase